MSGNGGLVIAVVLATLIVLAFMPGKAKWKPFGGMWKWDKRKGTLAVVVSLPRKKGRKR